MTAPKNPKRNHHHVWQAYLKPWTTNKEIWCLSEGEVALKRTKFIAVDRDFYKLHQLTPTDLTLLKLFISQGNKYSQETNQQLLYLITSPYEVVKHIPNLRPAAKIILEKYSFEVLEDYHSQIENSFAPLLEKARQGDLSFYTDEKCISFINYICTQYMRTKGVKERTVKKLAEIGAGDFSRIWNIMIHMFATNIGTGLYSERHKRILQLLENKSSVPFITGDQPIINLKSKNGQSPDQLSFYYPISPKLAIFLSDIDEPPMNPKIDEYEATELNKKIKDASYLQVFGDSKESLRI